jgi:prophage regulatory protein
VQTLPIALLPTRHDHSSAVFLRMPAVIKITGLGRSTIYRLMASHEFPSPVRLTSRAVAWRSTDIDAWSKQRPVVAH